jgi:hypothetical protein
VNVPTAHAIDEKFVLIRVLLLACLNLVTGEYEMAAGMLRYLAFTDSTTFWVYELMKP